MNVPNLLTLARIFLIPFFLLAFLTRLPYGELIAAGIFIVAAITDGVDGYLARKNREITRLGKFLDPLADKLLVSAALIALVELGMLSTWVAMVLIGREMAVTGLRAIAAAEGTVIAAGPWGKAKTVTQIVLIVTMILAGAPGFFLRSLAEWLQTPLLWAAVALTIWSGIDYGWAYYRGHLAASAAGEGAGERRPLKFRFRLPRGRKGPPRQGE
ncbi:MAG: CDP-diacylglycerol--glycerol-3-phosphate 3-phosphatidyltransferase [Bacillota bacterium]